MEGETRENTRRGVAAAAAKRHCLLSNNCCETLPNREGNNGLAAEREDD